MKFNKAQSVRNFMRVYTSVYVAFGEVTLEIGIYWEGVATMRKGCRNGKKTVSQIRLNKR